MSRDIHPPKYIIVLGTSYSGSGAVYDYLAGRGDLHDPLAGEEYLLPHLPNGLMSLESAAGPSFHHAISDHAVVQFERLTNILARPATRMYDGRNYSAYLPEFLSETVKFLNTVTAAEMPIQLIWRKLEESGVQRIMSRIKKRLGFPKRAKPTYLLVDRDKVCDAARIMHDGLFVWQSGIPTLLNQAGSGWNPIESTKYFESRKIVLVLRDPRDQFAELKKFKKAKDVEEFVKWFLALQERLNQIDDKALLKLNFEDFVYNHSSVVPRVCEFLGLDNEVSSTYRVDLSKNNIGKYKSWLTPWEVEHIEEMLIFKNRNKG